MSRKSAFTLAELLTVTVLISVTAALVFPGLSASRERARAAACLNNLGQLGMALQLYAGDHGGFLIILGAWTVDGEWPAPRYLRKGGYVANMDTWVCPSFPYYRYNRDEPRSTYSVLRSNAPASSHEECAVFNEKMWQALRYARDSEGEWLGNLGTYVYFPAIPFPPDYFLVGEGSHAERMRQEGHWVRSHDVHNLHMRHGEDSTGLLFADGHAVTVGRRRLRELDAVDRIWEHDMSGREAALDRTGGYYVQYSRLYRAPARGADTP